MIGDLTYASHWWAWWSNPVNQIHEDHKNTLPLTNDQLENIDYVHLLQIRSTLSLSDLPDELLETRMELRSLALATPAQFDQHLVRFALFTLDSSILHARPQDWESSFGVTSPELIREIITLKNDLPTELIQWQEGVARYLTNSLKKQLLIQERARVGFAIYLRSFFPRMYSRWLLTQSNEILEWANALETIPTDLWDVIDNWSSPSLVALHTEIYATFEIPTFEMPMGDDFDSEMFNLDEMMGDQDA
jgi:hypothetical protein